MFIKTKGRPGVSLPNAVRHDHIFAITIWDDSTLEDNPKTYVNIVPSHGNAVYLYQECDSLDQAIVIQDALVAEIEAELNRDKEGKSWREVNKAMLER